METQRHWQHGAQETQGPDTSAQRGHRSNKNMSHTAQWLPGVPGPQLQGAWVLLTCNNLYLCFGYSRLLQGLKASVERAILPASESPILPPMKMNRQLVCTLRCIMETTKTWPSGISKKIISLKCPQKTGPNLEFYIQLNSFKNEIQN